MKDIMDGTSNGTVSDAKKKEFELLIANTLLRSMNDGKISYDEARESAKFILKEFDAYYDKPTNFLQLLSSKWPLFTELFNQQEKSMQYSQEDQKKIDTIKNQLLSFASQTS